MELGPRRAILKKRILDALRTYGSRTKDQLVQDLKRPAPARVQAALEELEKEGLAQIQEQGLDGNHLWKLTRDAKASGEQRPGKAMD